MKTIDYNFKSLAYPNNLQKLTGCQRLTSFRLLSRLNELDMCGLFNRTVL